MVFHYYGTNLLVCLEIPCTMERSSTLRYSIFGSSLAYISSSTLTTLLNLSTDGTCGSRLVDMSHLQVSTILRKASLELKELAKT